MPHEGADTPQIHLDRYDNRCTVVEDDLPVAFGHGSDQQVVVGRIVAIALGLAACQIAHQGQATKPVILVDNNGAIRGNHALDPPGGVMHELDGFTGRQSDAAVRIVDVITVGGDLFDNASLIVDQISSTVWCGQRIVGTAKEGTSRVVGQTGRLLVEMTSGFLQDGVDRVKDVRHAGIGLPCGSIIWDTRHADGFRSKGETNPLAGG